MTDYRTAALAEEAEADLPLAPPDESERGNLTVVKWYVAATCGMYLALLSYLVTTASPGWLAISYGCTAPMWTASTTLMVAVWKRRKKRREASFRLLPDGRVTCLWCETRAADTFSMHAYACVPELRAANRRWS